jgi:hypothetical protein
MLNPLIWNIYIKIWLDCKKAYFHMDSQPKELDLGSQLFWNMIATNLMQLYTNPRN